MPVGYFIQGDAARLPFADGQFDLVCGSPPYVDKRTYGIGFRKAGQDWVDWLVACWSEFQRVCRGPVAMVVDGGVKNYQWDAAPALLMADLHRAGFNLRRPVIYRRNSVSGSGGPDDFRNDYEFIVRTSRPGRLPWSENTACGTAPKFKPGGRMSYRLKDGRRVSEHTARPPGGQMERQRYKPPAIANPGNVIDCGAVGGGRLGSKLAHESEAPFPEQIPERFIRSCCPPGGWVLDPFSGSGTTVAVAVRWGRNAIGLDLRLSQCELGARRLAEPVAAGNGKPKPAGPVPARERTLFDGMED